MDIFWLVLLSWGCFSLETEMGGKGHIFETLLKFLSHDSYLLLSLSYMQHGGMLMFLVLLQILPSNYYCCWRGSSVGCGSQTGSHKASGMGYSCSVKPHEAMKQVVPSGRGWCCGHVVFWEKCQGLSVISGLEMCGCHLAQVWVTSSYKICPNISEGKCCCHFCVHETQPQNCLVGWSYTAFLIL